MTKPHVASVKSYPVSIYIAGDHERARAACQQFCDEIGLCVTVSQTTYVYTKGSEAGVRVGLINYPRFPKDWFMIESQAYDLAVRLREELKQDSFSIETPNETHWFSWRAQDVAA